MAKPLNEDQITLLTAITQGLRRATALAFISLGYENQTQAYLNACESMGREPSKNPVTSASEILSYPNVIAFIESVKLVAAEEANISAKYVLNRLVEIDQLDVIDILDNTGNMLAIKDWKIKWPDKLKNLELLGRHVNIKAWDKEEEKPPTGDITINFVDAVKPSGD